MVDLVFETNHYFVFGARINEKRLLGKRSRHRVVALDMFGRPKISLGNGEIFRGNRAAVTAALDEFFKSKHFGIMPGVYLINSLREMDFSGLTSRSHILDAVSGEHAEDEDGVVVVDMS